MRKAIIAVFVLTLSVSAQTRTEHWVWKERAVKNRPQTQFSLNFQRRGSKVTGTYSVDQFINGEWQGEDGNQTPFTGTLKGGVIYVEFDPLATVPGYQENVKYQKPTDGRAPSKATIKIDGNVLSWTWISGEKIEGLADRLRLSRNRN